MLKLVLDLAKLYYKWIYNYGYLGLYILKKYIKDSHNSTKINDLTPCFLNMEWNGTLFIIQSTSKVIKANYVWIKSQ